jgi:Zn-dependent M28 family amino/carboxypeptidase
VLGGGVATIHAPRRSVLIAVTGEEKGLLGADYLAHLPPVAKQALAANVNVDMPLLLTPLAEIIAFGAEHSSLGPLAERAAALLSSGATAADGVVFSAATDYPFVRCGRALSRPAATR